MDEGLMQETLKQPAEYPLQKQVYEELFSLFQIAAKLEGDMVIEESLWSELNALVGRMGSDYSRFCIDGYSRHNTTGSWVRAIQLESSCLRMLSKMTVDYSFEDPHERLARLQHKGASIQNHVEAKAEARAEAHVEVELEVEKLSTALVGVLEAKDRDLIVPVLNDLKKKPTKENVVRLVELLKELGGVTANAALGVIAEMALKGLFGLPTL